MAYTNSQQEALNEIAKFLANPDEHEFLLMGAAGTGKTYVLDSLQNFAEDYFICCTALTNEAVSAIITNTSFEPSQVSTIHQFLGLICIEDQYTGEVSFVQKETKYAKEEGYLYMLEYMPDAKHILIIDEASMMDEKLYRLLHKSLKPIIDAGNLKVIYCGDPYQLLPVNADPLPLYVTYFSEPEKAVPHYHLTDLVRQKDPFIQGEITKIRSAIENGTIYLPSSNGSTVISISDPTDLVKEAFLENPDYATHIVSYTNKGAVAWNDVIKEYRTNAGLLAHTTFRMNDYFAGIPTGAILSFKGKDPQEAIVSLLDVEKLKSEGKVEFNDYPLICYEASFLKRGAWHSKWISFMEDSRTFFDYKTKFNKFRFSTKEYQQICRDNYKVLRDIADVRPGDALTVHKSQGSTFDQVFIDMHTFKFLQKDPETYMRLLYVAFTRAKNRIILIE